MLVQRNGNLFFEIVNLNNKIVKFSLKRIFKIVHIVKILFLLKLIYIDLNSSLRSFLSLIL